MGRETRGAGGEQPEAAGLRAFETGWRRDGECA